MVPGAPPSAARERERLRAHADAAALPGGGGGSGGGGGGGGEGAGTLGVALRALSAAALAVPRRLHANAVFGGYETVPRRKAWASAVYPALCAMNSEEEAAGGAGGAGAGGAGAGGAGAGA